MCIPPRNTTPAQAHWSAWYATGHRTHWSKTPVLKYQNQQFVNDTFQSGYVKSSLNSTVKKAL